MSFTILYSPNKAKMFTYDTAEEIPGYNPARVTSGQFVKIPDWATGGGRWMVVSPVNQTPWDEVPVHVLPDGFERIFGPRPNSNNFHGKGYPRNFQVAVVTWETDLRTYIGNFLPPVDVSTEQLAALHAEAIRYEMGEPAYYQNKYGYQVRFPESQAENFQANAEAWLGTGCGQIIVGYQNKITNMGIIIPEELMHPMAPPVLRQRQDKLRAAEAEAAKVGAEPEG